MTGVTRTRRPSDRTARARPAPTVLVVHPGAELFGSDRMLLESVVGLREAGCRVVVGLPSTGPLVDELESAGAVVEVVPIFVTRKALLHPRGWLALARSAVSGLVGSWRLMSRVHPEIVYISTITIPQWPLLARLRRTPAVSHIHEAEASGSRVLNTLLYLPHLASRRALVNSHFNLATIRGALPALARRSEVVYNGIDSPDDPQPPREHLRGALQLLYMGRLSPRKGPDLVIEAARRMQEMGGQVTVTILGTTFEGYEWYEEQLRAQADSSGVEVEFAGFHRDIWPFLAAADVLVVPSRGDESFGNTAVEGVLALRPAVASCYSGLREAAGDYTTTRLVPPDDPGAIVRALESLSEAWPQVVRNARANRAEALRRHAPEVYRRDVAAAVESHRSASALLTG